MDNGPEHRSEAFKDWAEEHGVTLVLIEPGKPTQNSFSESFNTRVREELLNANLLHTIPQPRDAADSWRASYNFDHANSSLGDRTPEEFLALYETTAPP